MECGTGIWTILWLGELKEKRGAISPVIPNESMVSPAM
jgi:hypothetical protein